MIKHTEMLLKGGTVRKRKIKVGFYELKFSQWMVFDTELEGGLVIIMICFYATAMVFCWLKIDV